MFFITLDQVSNNSNEESCGPISDIRHRHRLYFHEFNGSLVASGGDTSLNGKGFGVLEFLVNGCSSWNDSLVNRAANFSDLQMSARS